jgi:hypothetical protein
MPVRLTRISAPVLAVAVAACTTAPPSDAFTISAEAVTAAVGCIGGGDYHYDDGSVVHETVVCAGSYSAAVCTPRQTPTGRRLIARCRYTVTNGSRVLAHVSTFRCDNPTEDRHGCLNDFNWSEVKRR